MIHIEQGMRVLIEDIRFENNWLFDEYQLFQNTNGDGNALLISFNNCTGNVMFIFSLYQVSMSNVNV